MPSARIESHSAGHARRKIQARTPIARFATQLSRRECARAIESEAVPGSTKG